jgi:hypothetical protein
MKLRDELIVGLYVVGIVAGALLILALYAILYDTGRWFR